jgi:hypothetical protein
VVSVAVGVLVGARVFVDVSVAVDPGDGDAVGVSELVDAGVGVGGRVGIAVVAAPAVDEDKVGVSVGWSVCGGSCDSWVSPGATIPPATIPLRTTTASTTMLRSEISGPSKYVSNRLDRWCVTGITMIPVIIQINPPKAPRTPSVSSPIPAKMRAIPAT